MAQPHPRKSGKYLCLEYDVLCNPIKYAYFTFFFFLYEKQEFPHNLIIILSKRYPSDGPETCDIPRTNCSLENPNNRVAARLACTHTPMMSITYRGG